MPAMAAPSEAGAGQFQPRMKPFKHRPLTMFCAAESFF